MTKFELMVYETVRKIPKGKVASYGQIAAALGDVHFARAVGNAMHKNPVPFWELARQIGFECNSEGFMQYEKENQFLPVPCHRVVNSQGKMGKNFGLGGPEIQEKMLSLEGIEIQNGKVDLEKFKAALN